MNLLLLKITDTKTGEYVIARYVTDNPNKGWPNVPWLNRHNNKRRMKREILHFGVDIQDLNMAWERASHMFRDDPLNRTDTIPPVIKHSKPRSEEAKRKQSVAMKAKGKFSPQHKRKLSEAHKRTYANGRPPVISYHNAENTEKMNKVIKNNPYNKDRPKVKCEHCYKIVSINMYHRWHGDNCKNNW